MRPATTSQPVRRRAFHDKLLAFIHLQGVATARQIHQAFRREVRGERMAKIHLGFLCKHKQLTTLNVRGALQSFPHVYLTTPAGNRAARAAYADLGLSLLPRKENVARGRGIPSVLHEILTTQLVVECLRLEQERQDVTLRMAERHFSRLDGRWQLTYGEGEAARTIEPDAGIVTSRRSPRGTSVMFHAVETDLATTGVKQWREKLRRYSRWVLTDRRDYLTRLYARFGTIARTERYRPSWRLLVVVHDLNRGHAYDHQRLLTLLAASCDRGEQGGHVPLWLTTASALEAHDGDTSPLAHPLWVRAGDVRSRLPAGFAEEPWSRKRSRVAEVLDQVPRHALFPEPA